MPASRWIRNGVSTAAMLTLLGGCALLRKFNVIDPSANFVAHPGYSGLVVDQMAGGQTATLVRTRPTRFVGAPTHLFEVDGQPVAALWVTDPDHVVVRQTADPSTPPAGDVVASWKNTAIRITFHAADGAAFHTSRFDRVDAMDSREVLDHEMEDIRDLPGIYRADLRDEHEVPVGWVSVRILPYQGLPRDYQADLPGRVDGPLAAGAVALLDSEIGRIIELNAFPDDRMPEGLVP